MIGLCVLFLDDLDTPVECQVGSLVVVNEAGDSTVLTPGEKSAWGLALG